MDNDDDYKPFDPTPPDRRPMWRRRLGTWREWVLLGLGLAFIFFISKRENEAFYRRNPKAKQPDADRSK